MPLKKQKEIFYNLVVERTEKIEKIHVVLIFKI